MLILILIDVQYSQNAAFSFEKGSNCQNHSSSGYLHPVNPTSPSKVSGCYPTPHPLPLFEKPYPITQKSKMSQSDGATNLKNQKDNELVFK